MLQFQRFAADEQGATAIEYGLIIAILSAAIISTYTGVQAGLSGTYSTIVATLAAAP